MTAALTSPPDRTRVRAGHPLTGTAALVRLALRKDRVKLPAWTLAIAAFVPYFATVAATMLASPEDLRATAQMMDIPLLRLFTGPAFGLDDPTPQRYLIAAYYAEFLLAAALMNILLVTRHTRAEEQTGRAELVRAAVVGRHAQLAAALIVAVLTNACLVPLMAAGAISVGLPAGSALLFAAGTAATGLVFAAVTAVTAQVTAYSRTAAGLAGAVLGLAWLVRAIGAVQHPNGGPAAWLSPMAWAHLTRVLAGDRWWPLGLSLAAAAALSGLAFALSARRDMGRGILAPRSGKQAAAPWLRSAFTLTLRLQRGAVLWWTGALAAAGAVFGGLTGAMRPGAGVAVLGEDVQNGYLGLMAVGMTFLVAVFTTLSAARLRAEETQGRIAPLLSGPVGRRAWFASGLAVTALASLVMLAATAATMGAGAAASVGDPALFGRVAAAVMVRAPELLVVLGIAAALFGWAPRALGLTWAVLAYGVVMRFFSAQSGLPGWVTGLSPFDHIPRIPVEDFALAPLPALTVLGAALVAIGVAGFRRRDLDG